MTLHTSEWIVLGYFGYLGAATSLRLRGSARRRILGIAVLVVGSIVTVAAIGPSAAGLRDWAPLLYLVLGYWTPSLLVTTTNHAFERTLLGLDRQWFGGEGVHGMTRRMPRVLIELLEVAYLFCYPMVPLGLAALYVAGLRDETDRYWTAVLLAVFPCYGALPWLPTRPPRVLTGEQTQTPSAGIVRRINLHVLGRASIQLNTFPSGHAAASFAAALAVGARLPIPGLLLGLLALGISVGSVAGRYHYAADAVAGMALAIVAFIFSRVV